MSFNDKESNSFFFNTFLSIQDFAFQNSQEGPISYYVMKEKSPTNAQNPCLLLLNPLVILLLS